MLKCVWKFSVYMYPPVAPVSIPGLAVNSHLFALLYKPWFPLFISYLLTPTITPSYWLINSSNSLCAFCDFIKLFFAQRSGRHALLFPVRNRISGFAWMPIHYLRNLKLWTSKRHTLRAWHVNNINFESPSINVNTKLMFITLISVIMFHNTPCKLYD